MSDKLICIILARGGSKRIPKKNIKLFNNEPIIKYSINAAITIIGFIITSMSGETGGDGGMCPPQKISRGDASPHRRFSGGGRDLG